MINVLTGMSLQIMRSEEVKLPPFWEIMTDRQTGWQTDRRAHRGSFTSNKGMTVCMLVAGDLRIYEKPESGGHSLTRI